MRLVIDANIDLGLACAAAVLLLAYERFRERPSSALGFIMACALGFALGSKYIALISLLAPFLVMAIVDLAPARRFKVLAALAGVVVGAFLLWSPWLLRNGMLYKNPLYPLLVTVLGGTPPFFTDLFRLAHASAWAKYDAGIFPTPPEGIGIHEWVECFALPFRKSFTDSLPFGFSCLWLLGVPAWFRMRRDSLLFRLSVFVLVAYFTWFFATQRNDRFLAAQLVPLALFPCFGLLVLRDLPIQRLARSGLLIIIGFQLWTQTAGILGNEKASFLVSPTFDETYFAAHLPHYRAIDYLNQRMDQEKHANALPTVRDVLFIGEAQTYGADFHPIAPTVFNHHPLEQGLPFTVTHVLFNRFELDRLERMYGPYGWPLAHTMRAWLEANREQKLKLVFDAYPDQPGNIVVYEVIR